MFLSYANLARDKVCTYSYEEMRWFQKTRKFLLMLLYGFGTDTFTTPIIPPKLHRDFFPLSMATSHSSLVVQYDYSRRLSYLHWKLP